MIANVKLNTVDRSINHPLEKERGGLIFLGFPISVAGISFLKFYI